LKIGLGFAEVFFDNANCQTVETFQRGTSSYSGEGVVMLILFVSPFTGSTDGNNVTLSFSIAYLSRAINCMTTSANGHRCNKLRYI
jgi:hypothetical protein